MVYLHNEVSASYVGNSVVTTTTGMKLDTNDKITLTVRAGDELWIVGGGTSTLTFMEN